MPEINIHNIKHVKSIGEGDVHGGKRVNDFLAEGWVLLHVYSHSIASDHGPSQQVFYSIGWPGRNIQT